MTEYSFTYGAESEANKMLQTRLIKLGDLPAVNTLGKPNDDGIFGNDTAIALGKFLGATGPVRIVNQDTFNKLFPEQANTRSTTLNQLSAPDWTTGLAKNTIVQYVLVFVGGVVAAKFGLDPTQIKAALPDIINYTIAFIGAAGALWAAIMGAIKAAQPKVSAAGVTVPLKEMSPEDQHTIAVIAQKNAT